MITLKPYQQAAADNTLDIFRYVAGQIRQVEKTTERRAIVSHNGGVLLKAPTGSGKNPHRRRSGLRIEPGRKGRLVLVRSIQGARRADGVLDP